MSAYIKRLWRDKAMTLRQLSQLTKREGKFAGLLAHCMQRFGGKRGLKQTATMRAEMVDDMELITGVAKRELMLRQGGCDDPWAMRQPLKRGAGTSEQPTEIPSAFDGRLVGCVCLGDRFVKWMWLEKGEPKRCECGHFFVLKNVPPI